MKKTVNVPLYDWRVRYVISKSGELSCESEPEKARVTIKLAEKPDSPAGIQALSHECCHAAFDILACVGIKANQKHQEAFAYLQDWLVRAALEELCND